MNNHQGALDIEHPHEFAKRQRLNFNDISLLSRALTHRSYLNENPDAVEDNERLEFLGDAVLDFLVGAWLYHRFPEMSEGVLTRMRSVLVRTEQLAEFAQECDLGRAMRLGRGETESGGRSRPALLCATYEALIGAIYIDQGIDGVNAFFLPFLERVADHILENGSIKDPKSRLQEWTQSHGGSAPIYKTVASWGPDHAKRFRVEVVINGIVAGIGEGYSKQQAAKASATEALKQLRLV